MNSDQHENTPLEDTPEPDVRRHKFRMDLVWVIPIVAALVGAVLVVKAVIAKGPAVTIRFVSAEGVEAGKTRIKYKDVDVGKVRSIQLSEDLTHVTVTADMVPEVSDYLTGSTRFWIVRARVTASQISGLGTLFSGVYIGIDPGKEGQPARHFEGLESPPVVTMDMPGRHFNLRADRLGSLDIGAPVYTRQIKVGQVVSYQLKADGSAVDVRIFIQAPYDQKVNRRTRFWNASGLDVKVDSNGVQINTESLTTLFSGGVAFETSASLRPAEPPGENHIFQLYNSYDQINEPSYSHKAYLMAYFEDNVRGLNVGSPVEFRGIKVGEVSDLRLAFDQEKLNFRVPVLLAIEPERFSMLGQENASENDMFKRLIQKGLRAQLRTGLLLTGQMYVNLSLLPDAPPPSPARESIFPEIPTVPALEEKITTSVVNVLNRLEKVPFDQIGRDMETAVARIKDLLDSNDLQAALSDVRQSLANLETFSGQLNETTAPQLSAVLTEARHAFEKAQETLSAADHLLSADAPVGYELQQTLKELTKAARAVGALADFLERHPNALIYGKGSDQ
jgi:paraquat-inducible protein B